MDGLVSIEKLLLPGKMHNTDVKTTAVLKTLVLLKHLQFVLPKYLNGYPYTVYKQSSDNDLPNSRNSLSQHR